MSLKKSDVMIVYSDLSVQLSVPRRQSGLKSKEWRELKRKFSRLRKTHEVIEFFKLQKKAKKFKEFLEWQETFSDDFDAQQLNADKWVAHPSLIGLLPGLLYSSADDNQVFTDGNNLNFTDNAVQLITKKEKGTGLMFSEQFGFFPTERDYTSAIINTGEKYNLQYGKIEVKIKIHSLPKFVYHVAWLGAGKRLPHVNLFRLGDNLEFSAFAENEQQGEVQHVDLWWKYLLRKNTNYIIKLEWDIECMSWFINGRKMFSAPNIIDTPLYIAFSSGVTGEPHKLSPSVMEIDWVKAYQLRENQKI
jgi:hypothetical protein